MVSIEKHTGKFTSGLVSTSQTTQFLGSFVKHVICYFDQELTKNFVFKKKLFEVYF